MRWPPYVCTDSRLALAEDTCSTQNGQDEHQVGVVPAVFGLTSQVLEVLEALSRMVETWLNPLHEGLPGRRLLAKVETVGLLVLCL